MKPTRVMLVNDNQKHPPNLEQALLGQGLIVICRLDSALGLIKNVETHQPDVILIDLESPDRETFQNITALNQHTPRPVIMFSNNDDGQLVSQSIQAGVSTYIIDNLNPNKVKPIIDVAFARFHEHQTLKKELKDTQNQLADRKIIEKAKGLLMKTKNWDEERAYRAMRKMAMDQSKTIAGIAHNILYVMELIPPRTR